MKKQKFCVDCKSPVGDKIIYCHECKQTQKEALTIKGFEAARLCMGSLDSDLAPYFTELDKVYAALRSTAYASRNINFIEHAIDMIKGIR